jgi:hypothetical protein
MYESDQQTVENALENSTSQGLDNPDTIQTIIDLATDTGTNVTVEQVTSTGGTITVPAGTDIVFVTGSDTIQTTFTPPSNTPVVIFQGAGGVDVVFNDGGTGDANSEADRVVIGTAGDDNIVIADGKDTQVILGGGEGTVVGGSGDDTIVAGLGDSTIDGGAGDDVVVLNGSGANYVVVVTGNPNSAASGAPQATTTDHVLVTNVVTGITTDITDVQYVTLDNNDALIFATSTVEAGVAALYHAAFGRTGEQQGIEYWFDLADQGYSLNQIAHGFTISPEFMAGAAGKSDSQFVTDLYVNLFGRAPDAGGLTYWTTQMANGLSRADVLSGFATAAALNDAGVISTEATVVGSVTIVPHIV